MATTKQIIKTLDILTESGLTINYNNGDFTTVWRIERIGDEAFKFVMTDSPKNVYTIVWHDEIAKCKDMNGVLAFALEFARAY